MALHAGFACSAVCQGFNDDHGFALYSLLQVSNVQVGDTFLVQVGGYLSAAGQGVLNIQLTTPCAQQSDDAFEPNDSCATAVALAPGQHLGLFADFNHPDFYRVTVPPGGILVVDLLNATEDVDFDLYSSSCVYAATELDSWQRVNTGNTPVDILFEAFADPTNALECTDYSLDVQILQDPCHLANFGDDTFEPNDACSAATPITPGVYTGLGIHDTDPDFYSISIPPGQMLVWNHQAPFGHSLDFAIYDGACNLLQTSFGDFELSNAGFSTQQRIIGITHSSNQAACTRYDLDVSLVAAPCALTADDALEDNDSCAGAAPLAVGLHNNLWVSKVDPDVYLLCVGAGQTLTAEAFFVDATADVDLYLWDPSSSSCGLGNAGSSPLGSSLSVTDNEFLVWTNNTGSSMDVRLEVSVFPASVGTCNSYDLDISGIGGCGGLIQVQPFCDPMSPNSTGQSTTLNATGFSGTGSGLHLDALQGPPGQFAYFLVGSGPSEPGIPISQGRLCLDTSTGHWIARYNQAGTPWDSLGQFNSQGVLIALPGNGSGTGYDVPATLPSNGNPAITPGSTWHFQLWHREPAGATNFSNGVSVSFF
ncbi:MAG: hypothetical protein R3F17_12165 [Planctomycetota bacterium]